MERFIHINESFFAPPMAPPAGQRGGAPTPLAARTGQYPHNTALNNSHGSEGWMPYHAPPHPSSQRANRTQGELSRRNLRPPPAPTRYANLTHPMDDWTLHDYFEATVGPDGQLRLIYSPAIGINGTTDLLITDDHGDDAEYVQEDAIFRMLAGEVAPELEGIPSFGEPDPVNSIVDEILEELAAHGDRSNRPKRTLDEVGETLDERPAKRGRTRGPDRISEPASRPQPDRRTEPDIQPELAHNPFSGYPAGPPLQQQTDLSLPAAESTVAGQHQPTWTAFDDFYWRLLNAGHDAPQNPMGTSSNVNGHANDGGGNSNVISDYAFWVDQYNQGYNGWPGYPDP